MTDILMDQDGDLMIGPDGDLMVGDATTQHQRDLVEGDKGWYKDSPKRGVGVVSYLNDQGTMPGLTSLIRQELTADGQSVESVMVKPGGQVQIKATY